MMMRADRDNALRYLGSWVAAVAVVWSCLMILGRENVWVDRFILAEIIACSVPACIVIFRYTPVFTVRAIGIWSLMFGITVLMIAAGLLDLGVWGEPFRVQTPPKLPPGVHAPAVIPYWLRSVGRSMLAVAGPAIIWGYIHWWNDESDILVSGTKCK